LLYSRIIKRHSLFGGAFEAFLDRRSHGSTSHIAFRSRWEDLRICFDRDEPVSITLKAEF
jgi:hypothetical protein